MADTKVSRVARRRSQHGVNNARSGRYRTERCEHGFDKDQPELCSECRGGLSLEGCRGAQAAAVAKRKDVVLRLRRQGLFYADIAERMGLSLWTVGSYLSQLKRAGLDVSRGTVEDGCTDDCPHRRALVARIQLAEGEHRRSLKRSLAQHLLEHQPRLLVTGDGE